MNIKIIFLAFILLLANLHANENRANEAYKKIQKEDDYKISISELDKIYDKYPNYSKHDELSLKLSYLYILDEDYKNAIKILEKMYKDKKSEFNKEASLLLGSVYISTNNEKKALEAYTQMLKTLDKNDKFYPYVIFGIANTYFEMNSYYEARGNYERLIKGYKNFEDISFAMYRLAICYENTEDVPKAINTFNNILRDYPDSYSREIAQKKISTIKFVENTPKKTNDKKVMAEKKSDKITIHPASSNNIYQMGRFKDTTRAKSLKKIIQDIGYNSYIKEDLKDGNTSYVVRVDLPDDNRNIEEIRKRLSAENIPFFKVSK